MSRRIVVGISGASGAIYGLRLLAALGDLGWERHVVVSRAGRRTILEETGATIEDVRALSTRLYPPEDIGAAIASGSFVTAGMIVAPCSIRSAAEIATGVTAGLLTRAADVNLKDRRRVVLMVRETPLHTGHLRMLTTLSEIGAIIAPPVPAFYAMPRGLDDIVDHSVGRVLDLFGIENSLAHRWRDEPGTSDLIGAKTHDQSERNQSTHGDCGL
ncbi:UbiX family flavin prenyltransferase [Sphingomonas canadensis]|uniref:Flavin prenyltransferase UbiX n=1 Tax=Sphingomonas canadensis TaxID=1219257 RepID=A0ABW3H4V7_9SPHN|nr:UbiX family flavin prenyltransferase [Sphingomonas canadensis]MCW3836188.1 UbiX family flavin prenyltransferase [Sphingomonas canadensis]